MNKKSYDEMNKKELLDVAKRYGIKGRHKMNKTKLVSAIKLRDKMKEKIAKSEGKIKRRKLDVSYGVNHLELLPKEPGNVYVHWKIVGKEKKSDIFLRLRNKGKTVLEIPVASYKGKGYLRVEEGKSLAASIGFKKGKRFVSVISSEEIVVPRSKPSAKKTTKWAYVNPNTGRIVKRQKKVQDKNTLEEKKKKTEKTAKTVKYIKIPKER
ncbi:MAG: DUF4912 domain-containing protein [Caldisericota bacterium]|nr:DUF4912 domain-containing protein [Caldisericota bacterium]